ncbi:MAG: SpoIIE family protein phosphatase [Bacteroidia bacterium]|nr:SpoIIE family protein phosphatase [Bacteroidia bacterium]
MPFFKSIYVVIFIFAFCQTKAQVYAFSNFSSKNGLPNSTVNQVFQDSKGIIWIATQGGLDMFNGIAHKKFNKSSGIVGINITCITEDKNGSIWIATTEGASKFSNGKFINYTTQNGLKSNFINHIMCDSKNQIWLSTNEQGISVISDGKIKHITKAEGLTSDIIFSTYETSDKKIWVGTRKGGICIVDNFKVIKNYTADNGYQAKSAFCFFEDSKHHIWIGTNGKGLFKFSNNNFLKVKLQDIGTDFVSSIKEDQAHTIWVATETKGLMKIAGSDTLYIGEKNGLLNVYANHILIDKANNIWISTTGSGVFVLKNEYMRKIELSSPSVGLISNYKSNILAITSGIQIINEDGAYINLPELIGSAVLVNDDNSIWLANNSTGICKLSIDDKGVYKTLVTIKDSIFTNTPVVKILEVDANTYWALTFGKGIIEFNNEGVTRILDVNSKFLTSDNLLTADKSSNGEIWIGTSDAGAMLYNGHTFNTFNKEQGLNSLNINAISCDRKGNVFIGTSDDGLYCFTKNKLKHYSTTSNLISEQITALACDDDYSLWLGTNKGLSHLIFTPNLQLSGIHNYAQSHGFMAMEVSPNGLVINNDKIIISSVDGLYMLFKNSLPKNTIKPVIIFDELKINAELQNWNDEKYQIEKSTNLPANLVLNYKENRLSFDIRSLDFKDINELQFSYYLEGFDEKWSAYSSNNALYFSNLNHGKYILHAKAKDLSGVESDEIFFSFTITPPFYKTWWFICLCIIALITGIYFYIKTRTYKLIKEKQILEERVAQRTEFIEQQKHEIGAQKEIIETKNKEVMDSITYARRIQRAMLTSDFYIKKYLKDYFILFKPKDIVSGDFYWIYADPLNEGIVYVVTADCTGHGVPGGFMSMMGINLLKEIIDGRKITNPDDIINLLRKEIIKNLNQEGSLEESKDGMDMVICKYDFNAMTLEYVAANNALYVLRNKMLTEYKGDKMPVGIHGDDMRDFKSHKINLQKGDIVYTSTDGYPDQFGGPKGKKLMYKKFESTLLSISHLPMNDQLLKLKLFLKEWMHHQDDNANITEYHQIDDITIIGVKI